MTETPPDPRMPPGPRMPKALQTAIWFPQAQWMLDQCAARYGETFTLRIFREDTWVVLSNPEHLRQVFTGDPGVFHAGEAADAAVPGPSWAPSGCRAFRRFSATWRASIA